MIELKYPVIVEGKYDKIRVELVARGQIITTDGFGIFKKDEKAALFRTLAKKTPLIVLCDSDGAGTVIRSYLNSMVSSDRLIHLYIPEIMGKEKRKSAPSKAGTLGVEGMEKECLYNILAPYAADSDKVPGCDNPLSKTDFYSDGLSGGVGAVERRDKVAAMFDLPHGMSANALLAALKLVATYEEYKKAVEKVQREKNNE